MTLINDFLSLIYPRYCPACGILMFRHEKGICRLCRQKLPKSDFHLRSDNKLSQILGGRVPIEKTLCLYLFEKSGKVQKLVHAIKYKGRKDLAQYLGKLLAKEVEKSIDQNQFDLIVPVPLHAGKEKARGYNQSAEFARGLAWVLNIPLAENAIVRTRESSTQTRKKKFERWENVEGIFARNPDFDLSHKHLLLVDDVVTTGATIEALWESMKDLEGVRVSLACLGYAKSDGN